MGRKNIEVIQFSIRVVTSDRLKRFTLQGCDVFSNYVIYQPVLETNVYKDIEFAKKGILHNSLFIALLIAEFSVLSEYQVPGGGRFDEIARNADKLNSFSPVVFHTRYNAINMTKYRASIPYHGYSGNT